MYYVNMFIIVIKDVIFNKFCYVMYVRFFRNVVGKIKVVIMDVYIVFVSFVLGRVCVMRDLYEIRYDILKIDRLRFCKVLRIFLLYCG